jgi:hypothetical protein
VRPTIDVKAPIRECELDDWSRQIQEVQAAIMEEIEDTFRTATPMERQSLVNAMNTVHELQRIANRIRAKA